MYPWSYNLFAISTSFDVVAGAVRGAWLKVTLPELPESKTSLFSFSCSRIPAGASVCEISKVFIGGAVGTVTFGDLGAGVMTMDGSTTTVGCCGWSEALIEDFGADVTANVRAPSLRVTEPSVGKGKVLWQEICHKTNPAQKVVYVLYSQEVCSRWLYEHPLKKRGQKAFERRSLRVPQLGTFHKVLRIANDKLSGCAAYLSISCISSLWTASWAMKRNFWSDSKCCWAMSAIPALNSDNPALSPKKSVSGCISVFLWSNGHLHPVETEKEAHVADDWTLRIAWTLAQDEALSE